MRNRRGRTVCTLIVMVGLTMTVPLPIRASSEEPDVVVLLHGFGRTARSMGPLEESLRSAGFDVHNLSYRAWRSSPDELVAWLGAQVEACCDSAPRIHFVTHSLGGILVRAWMAEHEPRAVGRVVMIAPPNHGSEIADVVRASRVLRRIVGPTASVLGTDPDSLPNRLPAPSFELGVIAGIDAVNPFGDVFVPRPSDGTVSLASAELEGMRDFVAVRRSHTFIMRDAFVAEFAIRFLQHGCFIPEAEPPDPAP